MARTYDVKSLSVPGSIYEALKAKMHEEERLGSLTAYASGILRGYISGTLVNEELMRAKIEAELRKKILEELQGRGTYRPVVSVKAHRSQKEKGRESKHKAA